ncbi:MAG: hypothetical protein PHD61_06970 [Bacteroidales bacterium]|nr:hypothetical protein [Lentimicrobiaceae bacterium]MDD5695030.1 hypothetical protein [Bacteroidales bacterium]
MLLNINLKITVGRIIPWVLFLLLFSGCQVMQSWRIERINRIPEKNAIREEKLAEKEIIMQQKQFDKDYQYALKSHKKKQSDATLAHMKYLKKRSAYVNRHRKRSFCDRLFNPSCR